MSWHRQYRGRNIGRVLHFLYYYCGFDISNEALIGDNKITYFGTEIASYEFLSDTDIPYFYFNVPKGLGYSNPEEIKLMWEQSQKDKFFQAIKEAEDVKPEICQKCKQLQLQINILEDILKET